MNILIIEDDIFLANQIQKLFNKKIISNRIKILSSYNDFLRELKIINSYDLIIVDIILWNKNDKNGIDIINIIRLSNKSIPIIIISWLSELVWLEKWFENWASDYIIKPFRLEELKLRIYKWFKIYFYSDKSNNSEFLIYNWLEYCIEKNEFYFNKNKIHLTKGSKYLLWIFISNKEILLREDFLIEKIRWDIWFIIERNLRIVILRLKKSLQKEGIDHWIQNIRGRMIYTKKIDKINYLFF